VHADEAAAYGRLKKTLAQECAGDSLACTRRKTDFIQAMTDRAYVERGLPNSNQRES
jgi:GrpB-like predicted nucleotidyltransferase (UPF0157 family)